MVLDHRYAFAAKGGYNVPTTDDAAELRIGFYMLGSRSHNWSMCLPNSRSRIIFGIYFNCSEVRSRISQLSDRIRSILNTELSCFGADL